MKRAIMLVLTVVFVVAILGSCTSVWPVAGATGEVGSKVGQASQTSILNFPPNGNAGIQQAAENGGISSVGTVDLQIEWYYVFWKFTTIVTGS